MRLTHEEVVADLMDHEGLTKETLELLPEGVTLACDTMYNPPDHCCYDPAYGPDEGAICEGGLCCRYCGYPEHHRVPCRCADPAWHPFAAARQQELDGLTSATPVWEIYVEPAPRPWPQYGDYEPSSDTAQVEAIHVKSTWDRKTVSVSRTFREPNIAVEDDPRL